MSSSGDARGIPDAEPPRMREALDLEKDKGLPDEVCGHGNKEVLRGMEPRMYTYTLDYADQLCVQIAGFEYLEPLEVIYLNTLKVGLDYLNGLVEEEEARVAKEDDPSVYDANIQIMTCIFSWYSVTACDYVKTIGRIFYKGNKGRVDAYQERVIPIVYHWRNKVGAHGTFATPPFGHIVKVKIGDNEDRDLAYSKFAKAARGQMYSTFPAPNVQFRESVFVAGMSLGVPSPSGDGHVEDMTWSLTRIHTELAKRYWPHVQTLIPDS